MTQFQSPYSTYGTFGTYPYMMNSPYMTQTPFMTQSPYIQSPYLTQFPMVPQIFTQQYSTTTTTYTTPNQQTGQQGQGVTNQQSGVTPTFAGQTGVPSFNVSQNVQQPNISIPPIDPNLLNIANQMLSGMPQVIMPAGGAFNEPWVVFPLVIRTVEIDTVTEIPSQQVGQQQQVQQPLMTPVKGGDFERPEKDVSRTSTAQEIPPIKESVEPIKGGPSPLQNQSVPEKPPLPENIMAESGQFPDFSSTGLGPNIGHHQTLGEPVFLHETDDTTRPPPGFGAGFGQMPFQQQQFF